MSLWYGDLSLFDSVLKNSILSLLRDIVIFRDSPLLTSSPGLGRKSATSLILPCVPLNDFRSVIVDFIVNFLFFAPVTSAKNSNYLVTTGIPDCTDFLTHLA